ncbi:DNA-binding protein [Arcobacter sp. CECT 8983]|uniref:helix-turn-helix domain-containing protein n=1 Tax=Arcobacter sp. CECT 8983 TaxID=2044508 RepID=UPI00100B909D|nr:helix-turn-helix domain-containing protein [Arcobacter sp. CECT 8983]RXJ91614.1 DNA-binding protein [Arcobacter sp. CECT 8983]
MERLVTTAQAAQILGLSLQGVHYRIKKNQLKSIKKSGKTYVYINEYIQDQASKEEPHVELKEETFNGYKEVIKVKDEQIDLLKKSIKWMKKQYSSEIYRLEKNQKRIITVFNREIELLQSAFNEMRSIYKQPQIQTVQAKEDIEEEKEKFISLQEFTLYLKKHNKDQKDIKLIILKAIQEKDSRFIYNRKEKKLLILNEDFSDLI